MIYLFLFFVLQYFTNVQRICIFVEIGKISKRVVFCSFVGYFHSGAVCNKSCSANFVCKEDYCQEKCRNFFQSELVLL